MIIDAILAINPNAKVTVLADDINKITWLNGTQEISKETILAKQSELQALEDVYKNRRNEYGSIVSQLDEIYHDGIDAWKTRIASVKNKYPK
jgi:7-keto-8-aminopelargonate synthetase-like enzyme